MPMIDGGVLVQMTDRVPPGPRAVDAVRRLGVALALLASCAAGVFVADIHGSRPAHRPAPQTGLAPVPQQPRVPTEAQTLALPAATDIPWWHMATQVHHHPGLGGLDSVIDPQHRPSVVVFVYHQVCPQDWPLRNGPDYVTPARLAANFRFFRRHHIHTLTPAQFLAFVRGRATVPPGSVFLTFDNGLEGVYRYAFPLAKRYGVHITTFIVGDRSHNVWQSGQKYMGWNQLAAMEKSGLVGIQSETYNLHTHVSIAPGRSGPAMMVRWSTYPRGRRESDRAYVARLRRSFERQRRDFIAHLGTPPTMLVWPFSTYTRIAQFEARAAGYKVAFAVYPGLVTHSGGVDEYALPRNPATFMYNDVPIEYRELEAGDWQAIVPEADGMPVAAALRTDIARIAKQAGI